MNQAWSLETMLDNDEDSLELIALRIARDEYPLLSVADHMKKLDALAEPLVHASQGLASSQGLDADGQATLLSSYLYDRLGFHGNEDNYYDPRNSYLNDVMQRRTGIPISLAVVLMAVAKRVGIQAEGIGFPGHFLVRIGGENGVFLDPFCGGRKLTSDRLQQLAGLHLPGPAIVRPEHLAPVDHRTICVRMLINLKVAHEKRRDHARALVVCDRLYDLTRSAYFRRDRGLHALALGATASAKNDLEAYVDQSPNAADITYVRRVIKHAQNSQRAVLQ